MLLPGFPPEPLRVVCDGCGAQGWTFDYQHPDLAVTCSCCPFEHDHGEAANRTRKPCRPVTIHATARLALLGASDLLEAAGEPPLPAPEIPAERP
jgi:hypothetical protein